MKTNLFKIAATAVLTALIGKTAISQVNPTPRMLPFYETFGSNTYTAMPVGFGTGVVSGAPVSSQTAAQASTISAAATLAPATAIQTNGGSYGYAASNDAKFYVQHSSSTSTGTNQLIMAINTTYWHNIIISYAVEMINANPRTAGLVLQYRVGTSGSWTTISGSTYSHSSADRTNGQVDNYTSLTLPAAAEYQPVVQLRWASWRGTQTGNSSGVAVDNVNVSASPQGLPTNVSASSASSCSQIFLSEFVQDTLTNDGVELYNPTASSISLSGYYLTVTTGTNTATYFPLSGTVLSHSTNVVVNAKAPSSTLRGLANQLIPNFTFGYKDVVGLVYSANPMVAMVMIDVVGNPNGAPSDSGWAVSSYGLLGSTKNHDLTRLMNVSQGNLDWGKAQFEWYSHPMDTYSFLGFHSSICDDPSLPTVNYVNTSPSVGITGSTATNQHLTIDISIDLSSSGPLSNPIRVYYDDSWNYGNVEVGDESAPLSCMGDQTIASGDYSYPGSNSVVFNPSGAVTASYVLTYDPFLINPFCDGVPTTDGFICFALEDDPANPGMFNFGDDVCTVDFTCGTDEGIQGYFNSNQVLIYPNPFNSIVTFFNKSQSVITNISITDMLGREIVTVTPKQTNLITINTDSFESGAYFVKVSSNDNSFTTKLIKQ